MKLNYVVRLNTHDCPNICPTDKALNFYSIKYQKFLFDSFSLKLSHSIPYHPHTKMKDNFSYAGKGFMFLSLDSKRDFSLPLTEKP